MVDPIDRQAAIDAIHNADTQIYEGEAAVGRRNYMTKEECCEIIDSLPSAQPEYTEQDIRNEFSAGYDCGMEAAQHKIVRCKDCVHSDTFPKGADNDMPLKCLDIRYGGVMPDWFCEHAERRTE